MSGQASQGREEQISVLRIMDSFLFTEILERTLDSHQFMLDDPNSNRFYRQQQDQVVEDESPNLNPIENL